MRFILAGISVTLTFVLGAVPASSMTRVEFMVLVMPMSDIEANQKLENEFSALVEASDEAGIKALGDRIRAENGRALDEIAALARRLGADERSENPADTAMRAAEGKPPPPNSDRDVILTLGPCQYAGILLRSIVTGAGQGDLEPVFRRTTVMIDDNDIDTMFSQHMDRCEIIKDKLSPARLVGNRCLSTGSGCLDDPDYADRDGDEAK